MTDIRKDLETAAVAMADFEGGSIFRETLLNAIAALDAIELAYGLLWRCAVDRRTADGRRIYLARQALLGQLDRDGQARGIDAAQALMHDSVQNATCLLLDIHLGGISGIELQRRLAASGSKWPVIFITANDDEVTRNEAMDAGCVAYLRKPFAQDVLLNAISKAVA